MNKTVKMAAFLAARDMETRREMRRQLSGFFEKKYS
jgi:hypothetical protein